MDAETTRPNSDARGKIQWRRGEDGNCIPWVLVPGALQWMPYYSVPGHAKDIAFCSPGYPAFVGFLKANYEVVEGVGQG
jgi:hypothetical protein